MIPKRYEKMFFSPDDYKVGMLAKVVDEFKDGTLNDDGSPAKFAAFLRGEVELEGGEKRLLSLNRTSYDEISKDLGRDTSKWVGKFITFRGEQKCGKMLGRVWGGVK